VVDRNDRDLIEAGVKLRKDDLSNPSNLNGKGEFHLVKFGLATANDDAPSGAIVSNIYEPEDEYQNLYIGASRDQGIIQPPYFLRTLDRLTQENNALAPCIEAMVTNVDGTGYGFENKDKDADEPDTNDDDTNMDVLTDFFNEPWPGMSFRTMRKLLRRDLERVGNAYLEVLRNPQDKIIFIRHVDAKMMRCVRLDDPVPVKKTVIRNGNPVSVTVMTRERRFTQDVNGITLVFFKEFGASRDINKNTGAWIAQGSRLPANQRGTEIIHFINVPDAHTPYGIPRWVNQLPSILGSRRAEEFNLEFFEHGGVPPVLVLLQGGALGKETKKALESKATGKASKVNRLQVIEVEPNGGSWEQQSLTRVTVERFGGDRTTDSMFEKYDDKCELRVRRSFRLPPIFIGAAQDYTFASAYASYTVAEAQVFKPEREEFDEIISMQLIPAMGFAGYGLKSHPLTIEDSTLKLQGMQIAIQTGVVNDADMLDEINKATGTKLKADDQLSTIKLNGKLGLNPDGSKPLPPTVQGIGTTSLNPNPSASTDEGNPKAPQGQNGPLKLGTGITPPAKGKGQAPAKGNGAPVKAPSAPSGKGSLPGKGGAGKGAKGKVKKSEGELTMLAASIALAISKDARSEVIAYLDDVKSLDADERDELRDMTFNAMELYKAEGSQFALEGCEGHVHTRKGVHGAPNRAQTALAARLVKGKSAPSPVFNDGTGVTGAGDDDFAKKQTQKVIRESATSATKEDGVFKKFLAGMKA
jgi:PBSX family phage portal protein